MFDTILLLARPEAMVEILEAGEETDIHTTDLTV
jgi:hypothetical protein